MVLSPRLTQLPKTPTLAKTPESRDSAPPAPILAGQVEVAGEEAEVAVVAVAVAAAGGAREGAGGGQVLAQG